MNEWEWQLLEDKTPAGHVCVRGVELRKGDRVRLWPRAGGDIFDLALKGQVAVIEAIEQDYENKLHLAVVIENDPGRDLGMLRQPGHRFFFSPEEVEPLPQSRIADCGLGIEEESEALAAESPGENLQTGNDESAVPDPPSKGPRILVAGIGNIFLGDDAFGCEVARRLAGRALPEEVRVVDFGIRGFDLAYALLDGPDVTILIDATPRGGSPGTLYTIEPDLSELAAEGAQGAAVEPHGMEPWQVLRLARSLGGELKRILLVGCEPAPLEAEEGWMGLSAPVAEATDEAVKVVEQLVAKILDGGRRMPAPSTQKKGDSQR